jgi:hypothetical protein
LHRCFTKKEIQMTNKHRQRGRASLVLRKCKSAPDFQNEPGWGEAQHCGRLWFNPQPCKKKKPGGGAMEEEEEEGKEE